MKKIKIDFLAIALGITMIEILFIVTSVIL